MINDVKVVDFAKQKYGSPLLIDVAWIHDMPSFEKSVSPYRLNFYDITLVSQGKGYFWLDNEKYEVMPNTLLFTSPGQVRRWFADDLDGVCLFFPAETRMNEIELLAKIPYSQDNSAESRFAGIDGPDESTP